MDAAGVEAVYQQFKTAVIEWSIQRRYMTLETLAGLGENPTVSLPAVAS